MDEASEIGRDNGYTGRSHFTDFAEFRLKFSKNPRNKDVKKERERKTGNERGKSPKNVVEAVRYFVGGGFQCLEKHRGYGWSSEGCAVQSDMIAAGVGGLRNGSLSRLGWRQFANLNPLRFLHYFGP